MRLLLPLFLCVGIAAAADPAPGYVGAATCGTCHRAEFDLQSKSAHAHTLAPSAADQPGDWAFGAGSQAITFLRREDREHYRELGQTWYRELNGYGLTPGHRTANGVSFRLFDCRRPHPALFRLPLHWPHHAGRRRSRDSPRTGRTLRDVPRSREPARAGPCAPSSAKSGPSSGRRSQRLLRLLPSLQAGDRRRAHRSARPPQFALGTAAPGGQRLFPEEHRAPHLPDLPFAARAFGAECGRLRSRLRKVSCGAAPHHGRRRTKLLAMPHARHPHGKPGIPESSHCRVSSRRSARPRQCGPALICCSSAAASRGRPVLR